MRVISSLLLVLLMGLTYGARVSAEENPPILVVDMNRVFQDSIQGKAAIANFEQERKKRSQVIAKMDDDLRKLDEAIRKQSSILSAAAINEKKTQFDKKRAEFSKSAQDVQNELLKYQQAEFGKVLKQIDGIIENMVAAKKSRFVFDYDKRAVLYARKGLDLTDEVIEALDDKSI